MTADKELGMIEDYEIIPRYGSSALCSIKFKGGNKVTMDGQVCTILETNKMLVSYGFRCEQGMIIYGMVDAE